MYAVRSCLFAASALTLICTAGAAQAQQARKPGELPTDGGCQYSYLWREAYVGDHRCVSWQVRRIIVQENSNKLAHHKLGYSGVVLADCVQGYVWREARDGDTVCVTPESRARVKAENAGR